MKKKSGGWLYTVILIALLAVIAYCLYQIVPYVVNNQKTQSDFQTLRTSYVSEPEETEQTDEGQELEEYAKVRIDFASLQQINPDIKGWLRFDDTDTIPIDYPVLHNGDNDAYIHTDLYGKYSYAGCLFVEENNTANIDDESNTIIYGHNMNTGSMFGSLKKYRRDDTIYDSNAYFTYYTPTKIYRYQIFSYFVTTETSFVYQTGFGADEVYASYLQQLSASSMKNTGVTLAETDRVMILSTCTSGSDTSTERFVVCGKLIQEIEI